VDYYEIFKCECVFIGYVVNSSIVMVMGFLCYVDVVEVMWCGVDGFCFF